jgi:quercetin dioxygenase-like cupin family protein
MLGDQMTCSIRRTLAVSAAAAIALLSGPATPHAQAPEVKRTVILRHDTSMPGFEAVLVAVEIPPGGREGRHTHPGLAMVLVQEGTLTLDYEGKPTAAYKPGESFFVEAGKVHEGINKGTTTVKAIATFVVEKGKPITTQVPAATK